MTGASFSYDTREIDDDVAAARKMTGEKKGRELSRLRV
jgi:hypothetical protein